MPVTVTKKKTYSRRRRRTTRRRPVRRRTRKSSDFNFAKLKTIGMPYNMYTFMKLSTPTTYWEIYDNGTVPWTNPYQKNNNICFAAGVNQITPWNMQHTGLPTSIADDGYFGPPPTPSTPDQYAPQSGLYTWSGHTWWANWYRKMRITHVWVKYTIRPYVNATSASVSDPFNVTVFESKYIAGLNAPQILLQMNNDDLRASKGAKTFTIAGNRTKPLVIKRKINVQRLLGCKDLNDVQFTNCVINPDLTPSSLTNLVRNPSTQQQVFSYVRVSRATQAAGGPPVAERQAFTIQCELTCKVHFNQLNRNNPISLTGSLPTVQSGDDEDPTAGSSST